MINTYVVKSDHADKILAEVITDGHAITYRVDNTNGELPKLTGSSFQKLQEVTSEKHLSLEVPSEPTMSLQRYSITGGDTVEISTDGMVSFRNGRLMSDTERNQLFSDIQYGKVKVEARENEPVPVFPFRSPESKVTPQPADDTSLHELLKKHQEEYDKNHNSKYDQEIEEYDFKPAYGNDKISIKEAKRQWYKEKYGRRNRRGK